MCFFVSDMNISKSSLASKSTELSYSKKSTSLIEASKELPLCTGSENVSSCFRTRTCQLKERAKRPN